MTHTDRIADLIAAAGAIVVFHKLSEQFKQALEEPVDTPDEVCDMLWYAEAFKIALTKNKWQYEALRRTFAPDDRIAKTMDNLTKECGAEE